MPDRLLHLLECMCTCMPQGQIQDCRRGSQLSLLGQLDGEIKWGKAHFYAWPKWLQADRSTDGGTW